MNQRLSFPVSIVPYDPVFAVVAIGDTPSGQWDYEKWAIFRCFEEKIAKPETGVGHILRYYGILVVPP